MGLSYRPNRNQIFEFLNSKIAINGQHTFSSDPGV
jgi:hypothetical protein